MADGPLPSAGGVGAAAGATVAPFVDLLKSIPGGDTAVRRLTESLTILKDNLIISIGPLNHLGDTFGLIARAAPDVAQAVAKLGLSLQSFVALANPAVAEQFTLALKDTLAVIGQALTPVLQVATQILRIFGDAVAGFSGDLGQALGVIASALIPVFEVFAEVFARLGQVAAEVLKFVAPLIRFVAEGIKAVFEWLGRGIRFLLDLIGIEIGDSPLKKGASTGAAARSAQIGSVQDAISKAMVSALSLGLASGPNYAAMTAENTAQMIVRMNSLVDKVAKILDWLSKPFKAVDDAAGDIKSWFGDKIDDLAGRGTELGPFLGRVRRAVGRGALDGPGTVKADPP